MLVLFNWAQKKKLILFGKFPLYILSFAGKWMKLENIVVTEISQVQKA
jgi:hypothetical protein